MRIAVIGATGNAGSAVFKEAYERGHEPIAVVRNARKAYDMLGTEAIVVERDVFALTAKDLDGYDAVVDAFSTSPDQAEKHVELAQLLVDLAREDGLRPLFVLGAGSLTTGEDHHLFVEDLRRTPAAEQWIAIPEAQLKELEFLRTVEDVDWVGVSPQATFETGPAAPFELGDESLMRDEDGQSRTTTGTMAVAILDELENPAHRKARFTVANT